MTQNYYHITYKFLLTIFLITGLSISDSKAQCGPTADLCVKHLENDYISDGQSYRALLLEGELAEFSTTLFGGSQYRIAACSGVDDGNLIFSIYDEERNLIFTNEEYANAPFWNFKVNSTINCTIEAHLNSTSLVSGCAVIVIGFKN